MSKLPAEFVKAPAITTQAKQPKASKPRRTRKASSLISPEPVKDPREIVLHLTEEEYEALEEARQKLHQAGSEVTLEQMIHRVFADWIVRVRAIVAPPVVETAAPATEAASSDSTPAAAASPRDEHLLARLRAFVAAPLRTWQELAMQAWRRSHLRRGLQRAGFSTR